MRHAPPTSAQRSRLVTFALVSLVALPLAFAVGCDDDGGFSSEQCRFDPEACDGKAGAFCRNNGDCREPLHCCTDNGNCGDGMCTADCREDRDCPADMRCEHNLCFYACDSDRDCAIGMSCEHGNTVCEWE